MWRGYEKAPSAHARQRLREDYVMDATQPETAEGRSGLRERLTSYTALTTAIIAALAAIASLMCGRHGGRATSDLVRASNCWNYYQAKSLKTYILASERDMLGAMGKTPDSDEAAKLEDLEREKREIKTQAEA